eukprot:gene5709-25043_t
MDKVKRWVTLPEPIEPISPSDDDDYRVRVRASKHEQWRDGTIVGFRGSKPLVEPKLAFDRCRQSRAPPRAALAAPAII